MILVTDTRSYYCVCLLYLMNILNDTINLIVTRVLCVCKRETHKEN